MRSKNLFSGPGLYALASLVFLPSCEATLVDVTEWHADPAFTEAERHELARGTAWMAEQVGERPPLLIYDGRKDWSHTLRRGPGMLDGRPRTGLYVPPSTIYVDPVGAGPYLAGVVAHEMGHYHGLADDPESAGIMSWVDDLRWTEREERQCEVVRCRR